MIQAGGGAEEEPMAMVLLAVTEQEAERSRFAQMLREVYRETGPTTTGAAAIEKVVREINSDWLSFVTGD
jgi:hypothetical protein